jgi:hypothetical protein
MDMTGKELQTDLLTHAQFSRFGFLGCCSPDSRANALVGCLLGHIGFVAQNVLRAKAA